MPTGLCKDCIFWDMSWDTVHPLYTPFKKAGPYGECAKQNENEVFFAHDEGRGYATLFTKPEFGCNQFTEREQQHANRGITIP